MSALVLRATDARAKVAAGRGLMFIVRGAEGHLAA